MVATASGAYVWLWTINGRLLLRKSTHSVSREPPASLAFAGKEFYNGRLSVIITGHRGKIAIWNVVSCHEETTKDEPRWGLQCIHVLETQTASLITALSINDSRFYSGDDEGMVYCWALPGHAVNVPSDDCMAGCGKRFGFLDARRQCAACGGCFCTTCTITHSASNMRCVKKLTSLCNSCSAVLSRD